MTTMTMIATTTVVRGEDAAADERRAHSIVATNRPDARSGGSAFMRKHARFKALKRVQEVALRQQSCIGNL
jgi:hypothetical protein